MSAGWSLVDADHLAGMYPERFSLHPDAALLMPGDQCRVAIAAAETETLHAPMSGERFWLRVVERTSAGTYVGVLDHPLNLAPLGAGDTLRFNSAHVLDVYEEHA